MKRILCIMVSAALALSLSACSTTPYSTANNSTSESLTEVSSKTKSDELKEKYGFYEKTVKEIIKQMEVTQEQADEIFITLVDCGLNQEPTYIIGSNGDYTVDFGKIGEGVTNLYVKTENGVITEVKNGLTIVYPEQSAESEPINEIKDLYESELNQEPEKTLVESSDSAETPSTESTCTYEFDTLQNIFNSIGENTTMYDIESLISQNSLEFTVENYHYCIAYTKGSALQRYADSGDYIEISFDKSNGAILHSQYCTPKSSRSALFYNYGVWYSFDNDSPSEYTGYYTIAPLEKEHGIVIKYDNGNETETNYFKCDSAEEAIKAVIDSTMTLKGDLSTTESAAASEPEKSKVEFSAPSVPETTQTESSSTATIPPQSTSATTLSTPQYKPSVVYIAASGNGTKYHRSPNCSKMNGNVIEMTREEAEAAGYTACKKSSCYG